MRVQNVFLVTLGLALAISFVLVSAIFYRHALGQSEVEAMREARMLLAVATAARMETAERLTPLLAQLPPDRFHPESVPSHGAQSVLRRFNAEFPEYSYREKALNPTNLDDLANSWEVDVIQAFRDDRSVGEMSGSRRIDGRDTFFIAQPIAVKEQACLACHSKPEAAPAAMVATYGPAAGFGWKLDEVVGAKFITVPKGPKLDAALRNVFWFLAAFASVLILVMLIASVLVRRVVADPAAKLASQAEALSRGEEGAPELQASGAPEFQRLARAINRLHRSVRLMLAEREAN